MLRSFLFICSCFFLPLFNISAQSPYQLNLKKDLLIGGIGLGLDILALQAIDKTTPHDALSLSQLNIENINSFDRPSVFNNSALARDRSDIILTSSLAFPFVTLFGKRMRKDFLTIGVMGIETMAWNIGLTGLTKGLVNRTRPFVYNDLVPVEERTEINGKLSFYSGHTSQVATLSFFTAKVLTDFHTDSKWKPFIWSIATLIPATTGYLRVKGGEHFPTDVIVGGLMGGFVGIMIPQLHKKKVKEHQKVSFSLLQRGQEVGFVMRW